jgi:hypothetical protein
VPPNDRAFKGCEGRRFQIACRKVVHIARIPRRLLRRKAVFDKPPEWRKGILQQQRPNRISIFLRWVTILTANVTGNERYSIVGRAQQENDSAGPRDNLIADDISVSCASWFGRSAVGTRARDDMESGCRNTDEFIEWPEDYSFRSHQSEDILGHLPGIFVERYKFDFYPGNEIQGIFVSSIDATLFVCATHRKTNIGYVVLRNA